LFKNKTTESLPPGCLEISRRDRRSPKKGSKAGKKVTARNDPRRRRKGRGLETNAGGYKTDNSRGVPRSRGYLVYKKKKMGGGELRGQKEKILRKKTTSGPDW